MSSFELSNHVEAGKEDARDLVGHLKALQQTLKDTDADTSILQALNICVFKAQELSTESFLFIEKEANKYVSHQTSPPEIQSNRTPDNDSLDSAKKMTSFLTNRVISKTIDHLASQAHTHFPQNNLAVLVLRYYFEGCDGATNRRSLEARLRDAGELVGSLGDYPWTSEFEDVLERYRNKVDKLALEVVVEEVKVMVERQAWICFGVD
ncbi:hypothetical protein QM012_009572 [Aureobasidium pullulans]|uniref:Uncharacterized protein n=1 Tax=Aureobasidium pullulans TaxID=5580 RepID=A0ABR0TIR8_AURPU